VSEKNRVDLVVVGNLLIDQLPNGHVEPGGAALFTALAARRAGLSVAVHSVVGSDYPVEILQGLGIELSLHVLEGPGGRTVISYRENQRDLTHEGPGHEAMTPQRPHPFDASLVHIGPMPWSWQVYHLKNCRKATALLDPYPVLTSKSLRELEPYSDRLLYLLVNEEELEVDLSELPSHLPALVKQGVRGGYCLRSGVSWSAQLVDTVDPTGAGDSFAAGLAAGHLAGWEPARCFQFGAKLAARVVSDVGARAFL
jgi:nucleoside kinase